MIFKPGVVLRLQPDMAVALPIIDDAHQSADLDRLAVVTSANDGTHMAGSLHAKGLAIDLRTKDLHAVSIAVLANELRRHLNGKADINRPYQVVVEERPPHIHVEYQPVPGGTDA